MDLGDISWNIIGWLTIPAVVSLIAINIIGSLLGTFLGLVFFFALVIAFWVAAIKSESLLYVSAVVETLMFIVVLVSPDLWPKIFVSWF